MSWVKSLAAGAAGSYSSQRCVAAFQCQITEKVASNGASASPGAAVGPVWATLFQPFSSRRCWFGTTPTRPTLSVAPEVMWIQYAVFWAKSAKSLVSGDCGLNDFQVWLGASKVQIASYWPWIGASAASTGWAGPT